MSKFQNRYRIESARLKGWDYTTPWWYFVTINTQYGKKYFGSIIDEKVCLSEIGKIAKRAWLSTAELRENVELDCFVVMPNHIHGIIVINEKGDGLNVGNLRNGGFGDVQQNVCTIDDVVEKDMQRFFSKISPKSNSLSVIIRGFKASVTKEVHLKGYSDFQWHSRFHDRIIRSEKELFNVRNYIKKNPSKGK